MKLSKPWKHPHPPVGTRFGRLVVIGHAEIVPCKNQGYAKIPCRCDCGEESMFYPHNLRSGRSRSCQWCGQEKSINKNVSRADSKRGPKKCGKCQASTSRRGNLCVVCSAKSRIGKSTLGYPMTLREAGEKLGLSVQRVSRIVHSDGWESVFARMSKENA